MRLKAGTALDRQLGWYVATLLAQAILGLRSWRQYRDVPPLRAQPATAGPWPRVAIVVPARDEAHRLAPLLASLRALDYPDYEILVVDDDSSDGTAALAEAAGARVRRGAPLPAGWAGKAFACHQGVGATVGEWILFTDADTVHAPASLRAAVAHARQGGLDVLSLLPGHRCDTFFERLIIPLAFSVVFAGTPSRGAPAHEGRLPGGVIPINGQYILCRRDLYLRTGGYARVGASVIEDALLMGVLGRERHRSRLCRAEGLVQVRLYGNLGELWGGFRKNTARYAAHDPRPLLGMVAYGAVLGGLPRLVVVAARTRRRSLWAATLLSYGIGGAWLAPWYRRFGVPRGYALLYPLGVALLAAIASDSAMRTASGHGVTWKGRRYR